MNYLENTVQPAVNSKNRKIGFLELYLKLHLSFYCSGISSFCWRIREGFKQSLIHLLHWQKKKKKEVIKCIYADHAFYILNSLKVHLHIKKITLYILQGHI